MDIAPPMDRREEQSVEQVIKAQRLTFLWKCIVMN